MRAWIALPVAGLLALGACADDQRLADASTIACPDGTGAASGDSCPSPAPPPPPERVEVVHCRDGSTVLSGERCGREARGERSVQPITRPPIPPPPGIDNE